jgi:hypothetical protein
MTTVAMVDAITADEATMMVVVIVAITVTEVVAGNS